MYILQAGVEDIKTGVEAVVCKVIVAKLRVGNGVGGARQTFGWTLTSKTLFLFVLPTYHLLL